MAVELASRALGTPPPMISGSRIPGQIPNTLALNFDGGADPIPTFSLADLRACIEKGDSEFFHANFAGKVVLIATVLDVEDRQVTSKRFATAPENPIGMRCTLAQPPPSTAFARDSTPGVYTHATAVNNLIRGDALIELGAIGRGAIAFTFAAIVAAATLTLPLLAAVPAYLAAALLWTFGAVLAFTYSPLALPLIEPLLAGVVSLGATTSFRFLVADKDRRFLHKTFGLYLAPSVIEKMVTANKPPALGGEIRNVTVFFSDLAGFSSISEVLTPPDLVKFMNLYFSAMTDIIQEHGGLVEKYIGDAIFAVFGAPYDDPDHAGNAVSAALRCRERLHRLNIEPAEWQRFTLRQRIGLNTGDALVLHRDGRYCEHRLAARRRQQIFRHRDYGREKHVRACRCKLCLARARHRARSRPRRAGAHLRTACASWRRNSRAESRNGRLCARIGVLAPPRFCPLRRGARAGGRHRSALGDSAAAGQEISGASTGDRLGRRQHAGREMTVASNRFRSAHSRLSGNQNTSWVSRLRGDERFEL